MALPKIATMKSNESPLTTLFNDPLTILRVWLGTAFIMHGLPGIFDLDYMAGHAGMMELYNIPIPEFTAYLSKGGELLAGVLLLVGWWTRLGTMIIVINMLVATFIALRGDIFGDFQAEISFTYLLMALVLFFNGPTAFSLDQIWYQRSTEVLPGES